MPTDPTDAAIRAQRRRSNEAIAARDAEQVVAFMDPEVTVAVAGGPVLRGREASRRAFAEQFADRAFGGYVRTTEQVTAGPDASHAAERGQWEGRWHTKTGVHTQRGHYAAEWVLTPMGWFIRSETYETAQPPRNRSR